MTTRTHRGPGLAAWVRRYLLGVVLVVLLIVGGTAFRVWQEARADDRTAADMILVLGAAQYNGTPTDVFAARLEHAKNLYQEGVAGKIVTSGGKQEGDTYTEGETGARWLAAHGVPAGNIVTVPEGNDTLGTMQAVADQVGKLKLHSAVIVSDPWHLLRAETMADDVGLTTRGSPTHSGPIVQKRQTQGQYILRETGALLFYRLTRAPVESIGAASIH